MRKVIIIHKNTIEKEHSHSDGHPASKRFRSQRSTVITLGL